MHGWRWVGIVVAASAMSCSDTGTPSDPMGMAGAGAFVPGPPGPANPMSGQTAGVGAGVGTAGTDGAPTQPVAGAGTGTAGVGSDPSMPDPMMPVTGPCGMPSLNLDGLMYSPGGTVLPKGCEPYHATLNNPYAVRCVDAWPWYETRFPGDEYCILPPEPGKGIQVGVHPQGKQWYAQVSTRDLSGYQSPAAPFLMASGQEGEANYTSSADNTEQRNYYRAYVRMRAGSHHMIVTALAPMGGRESWGPGAPVGLFAGEGIPGAQRPDENTPVSLEKPAEDAGLFRRLPASQDVVFNMHHFNSTSGQILKEAWINLWWEEDASIEIHGIRGMPLTQALATFARAGQTVDVHHSWNITQDVRIVTLFGHRHVWTPNFSAWVRKPDGTNEIVYQSFDWFDMPTYRYDSLTQNPPPNPQMRQDGATSGVLTVRRGEQLHFNCRMAFTNEHAAAHMAPMPSTINGGQLRFANQAFTGEMCILFGSSAAVRLPEPRVDTTPVPDFARIE
jgi:hypothetical protein